MGKNLLIFAAFVFLYGCAAIEGDVIAVRRSAVVPLAGGGTLEFISPKTPDIQGRVIEGFLTVHNDGKQTSIVNATSMVTSAPGVVDQILGMVQEIGKNAAMGLGFDFPANKSSTNVSQTGGGAVAGGSTAFSGGSTSLAGGGTGVGLGGAGGAGGVASAGASSGAYSGSRASSGASAGASSYQNQSQSQYQSQYESSTNFNSNYNNNNVSQQPTPRPHH